MQPQSNRFCRLSSAMEGFLLAKAAEGRSHKTLADYRYCLRIFATWLAANDYGDPPAGDLTPDDLRRFFAELRQRTPTLSAKTIRNIYITLSSLWSWLGQEAGLPHIVRPVKVATPHPPALRLPTQEEVVRLLKACDYASESRPGNRRAFRTRRPTALRDRCIIMTLLDTGLRAAELCALRLDDLDVKSGVMLVRHGKGDKARIVYAGKATRRVLWRYLAGERKDARPSDPLFVTRDGRPLTPSHLSHLVMHLGRRAGVRVWPHLLRHVFATEFLRAGGSTLALRRLLGHASDALLARYAEIADCDLQEACDRASPADRWRL